MGRFPRLRTLLGGTLVTLVAAAWLTTPARPALAAETATMDVIGVDTARYPEVAATLSLPPALADAGPTAERFRVEENGQPRTPTVTRLPGDSLEVVLVVDTSGSMGGAPLAAARAAAAAFLAQVPPTARVGLVGFGSAPKLASPLSTDRGALAAAVGALAAGGETSLYDSVALALDQFGPAAHTRRHVIVLSDGGDTASTTALDALQARLSGSDVHLDVAELATSESRHGALVTLAAAGRGAVVPAADPAALTAIYDTLGRGLADQYLVQVTATGHGSTRFRFAVDDGDRGATADATVELPEAAGAPASPPTTAEPEAARSAAGAGVLAAGAVLCFGALLLGASLLPVGDGRRVRLVTRATRPGSAAPGAVMSSVTQRAAAAADEALERHGRRRGVNAALERAGLSLRPGEFVVLAAGAAGAALLLGTLLGGLLAGVVLAAATAAVTRVALGVLARRRQRRFREQLGDDLQLMAGSLRTGYAVLQAIDAVAQEAESPSREEFRRVTVEARLGRDLDTSLRAMADRVGGDDFTWVAQAIEINRKVGGDLAEVLENVAGTMRERERVRRQVRAVSAEGRISAYVLVALPVVMAGVLSLINRGYIVELTRGAGLALSAAGVVMLALGSLWLSRLVKVEY